MRGGREEEDKSEAHKHTMLSQSGTDPYRSQEVLHAHSQRREHIGSDGFRRRPWQNRVGSATESERKRTNVSRIIHNTVELAGRTLTTD